jgi:hypothetical protein
VIKRLCVTARAFDKSNGCDADRRRDPTPIHTTCRLFQICEAS